MQTKGRRGSPRGSSALRPGQFPQRFLWTLNPHAAGEHLDPGAVLAALPDATPLAEAQQALAALLAERQHRCRDGAVVRSLRRSTHLAAAATRAEVRGNILLLPGGPCQRTSRGLRLIGSSVCLLVMAVLKMHSHAGVSRSPHRQCPA